MKEKELRRLRRADLLEMLIEQSKEADRLRGQIAEMEAQQQMSDARLRSCEERLAECETEKKAFEAAQLEQESERRENEAERRELEARMREAETQAHDWETKFHQQRLETEQQLTRVAELEGRLAQIADGVACEPKQKQEVPAAFPDTSEAKELLDQSGEALNSYLEHMTELNEKAGQAVQMMKEAQTLTDQYRQALQQLNDTLKVRSDQEIVVVEQKDGIGQRTGGTSKKQAILKKMADGRAGVLEMLERRK